MGPHPERSANKKRGVPLRDLYQPYRTPPGCHDSPYIYLYDGNSLTDGLDYVDQLSQRLDADSEFILRRIAGFTSTAQFFTYRDNVGRYIWTPPATAQGFGQQADIGVPFELGYGGRQAAGQIRFDLLNVQKSLATSGGTDFLAYIAFQGVKRFPWDRAPVPCPYRLRAYEYVLNIPAVDWTRGQYRRFSVKIDRTGDFELDRIVQVNATNVPDTRVGVFNYLLYDPNQWQMMSLPVPDSYICDTSNGILTTDPAPMPGIFPCPAMLYPRMSLITIDLYATQSTPQGDCWQILLIGQERIPLSGEAPVYS